MTEPYEALGSDELAWLDRWWRATNYLSVGQIYLLSNPLLTEPLKPEDTKPRLLGHWGTTPGLNLVAAHLNRVIRLRDLDLMFVCGPGHGGPAVVAQSWLEGTYTERYPHITRDLKGMERLFRQFSFPGGIPSHASPETPGSINEGGELGYSLLHAAGAVFDNPGLVVACVIGDGEAETGALATSWHATKFLNPVSDGTVLPILHLNGYKIANPTVLARIPEDELRSLLRGYGWEPSFVTSADTAGVHHDLARALDEAFDGISAARSTHTGRRTGANRPLWPMIVLRTPKGWTGPRVVDGLQVEGTWRAHQVPLAAVRTNPEHLEQLELWMKSYRAEELFDADGRPCDDLTRGAPPDEKRMGANLHANGGLLTVELELPDFTSYAVHIERAGESAASATGTLGVWLRDVVEANRGRFRIFGPDETVRRPPLA